MGAHPMFPVTGNAEHGWDKIRTSKRAAGMTVRQILGQVFSVVESEMKPEEAAKALATAFGLTNGDAGLVVPIAMAVAQIKRTDADWRLGIVDPNFLPEQVIRRGLLSADPESRAAALEQVSEDFRPRIEAVLTAEDEAVSVIMNNPRNVVGAMKAIAPIIRGPAAKQLVDEGLYIEAMRRIEVRKVAEADEMDRKARELSAALAAEAAKEESAPAELPSAEQIAKRIEEAFTSVRLQVRKLIVEGKAPGAMKIVEGALTGIVADPKAEAEGRVAEELHAMIREKAAEIQKALEVGDLATATVLLMEVGLYPQGDSFTAKEVQWWFETAGVKAEAPEKPTAPVVKIVKTDPAPAPPAAKKADKVEAEAEREEKSEPSADPVAELIVVIETTEGLELPAEAKKPGSEFYKGLQALLTNTEAPDLEPAQIAAKLGSFEGGSGKQWAANFAGWSATKAGPVGKTLEKARKNANKPVVPASGPPLTVPEEGPASAGGFHDEPEAVSAETAQAVIEPVQPEPVVLEPAAEEEEEEVEEVDRFARLSPKQRKRAEERLARDRAKARGGK